MKNKSLLVNILIFIACISSEARLPESWFFNHFNVGLEWGYTQCIARTWDYNIISEEGYRIYDEGREWMFRPNGSVLGQIGFLLNDDFVIALYSGFVGVGEDNRLMPVQLRLSWFPGPPDEDGAFFFFPGGPAFHLRQQETRPAWMFASGIGFRHRLNYDCNLDISLGLKYLNDHPLLPSPDGAGNVPAHNIRKNDAGYCALDLTLGFNF